MRPCARPYSLHASLATCPHRSAKCARRLWPDGPSPLGASPPSEPQLGFVFIEGQDRPLASRLAPCSSLAPSTVDHSGSFLVRARNQPFKTLLRARYIPHLGLAIAHCPLRAFSCCLYGRAPKACQQHNYRPTAVPFARCNWNTH